MTSCPAPLLLPLFHDFSRQFLTAARAVPPPGGGVWEKRSQGMTQNKKKKEDVYDRW